METPAFPTPPAPTVRVFHFADVHLGVETHGKFNPQTGLNTRFEDFTKSLNEAIDTALDSDIDIAVFAGDAYKSRDPNQTHQIRFAEAVKRVTDAGIPIVLLVGNHDIPNTRGRANALDIFGILSGPLVTIIRRPELHEIPTRRGPVVVAGMPYLTRSAAVAQEVARNKSIEEVSFLVRDRYAGYITDMANDIRAAYPEHIAILTGHFTIADAQIGVQSFLMSVNEPQVPLSEILVSQPSPWHYVAMGHIHKPQDMNKGQNPPVIYSGSTDRIDFGERKENKGFVLADVRRSGSTWKHIQVKTRPFLDIHVDTATADDPTQAILSELEKFPISEAVVKLSYKVPTDKAALVRLDEIRKALAPAHTIVALSRDLPQGETVVRSQAMTVALTPEEALSLYLDTQERLLPRKAELLTAAKPLFDALEQKEALR